MLVLQKCPAFQFWTSSDEEHTDFASVILFDLEVNKPDLNSLDAVIDIKEKSYEIIS